MATGIGIDIDGDLLEILHLDANINANVTLLSQKKDSYSDIVVSNFYIQSSFIDKPRNETRNGHFQNFGWG